MIPSVSLRLRPSRAICRRLIQIFDLWGDADLVDISGKETPGYQRYRSSGRTLNSFRAGLGWPKSITLNTTRGERFYFVDGLRGVACAAVVLHHLFLELWVYHICPNQGPLARTIRVHGALGVEIFFVISGFVIAHSLRNFDGTFKSAGLFILKRQLRLDPPFWIALLGASAVLLLHRAADRASLPIPGPTVLLANILYLHRILGVREILVVSWTLCLEVQFYLLYIGILLCISKVAKSRFIEATALTITVTAIASLCFTDPTPLQTWFLPYWHLFAGGVLTYWVWRKRVSAMWLLVAGLSAAACYAVTRNTYVLAGWLTITALFFTAAFGKLESWTLGSPLQYLGRISYSLYLIHRPIMVLPMWLAEKHHFHSSLLITGWSLMTLVVCLAAAHLLWYLVEKPSMRISSSIGRWLGRGMVPLSQQLFGVVKPRPARWASAVDDERQAIAY